MDLREAFFEKPQAYTAICKPYIVRLRMKPEKADAENH